MNVITISEDEFRAIRHDIRDHLQAIMLGVQVVREAIQENDREIAMRTLEQMKNTLDQLNLHRFMSTEMPFELRRV